jgi:hypothetical protein
MSSGSTPAGGVVQSVLQKLTGGSKGSSGGGSGSQGSQGSGVSSDPTNPDYTPPDVQDPGLGDAANIDIIPPDASVGSDLADLSDFGF